MTVPQGFAFLHDQLLFNEGKARQIVKGVFHEKAAVLQSTTKQLLASFASMNG